MSDKGDLDKLSAIVLEYLRENPGSGAAVLRKATGLSSADLGRLVARLQDDGLVTRADHYETWRLAEPTPRIAAVRRMLEALSSAPKGLPKVELIRIGGQTASRARVLELLALMLRYGQIGQGRRNMVILPRGLEMLPSAPPPATMMRPYVPPPQPPRRPGAFAFRAAPSIMSDKARSYWATTGDDR